MEHETAGDPVSGCKWTRKTTGKIAQQLKRAGIQVSANTVGRLLRKMDFSLRMNLKSLESGLRKPPAPASGTSSSATSAPRSKTTLRKGCR